MCSHTVAYIDIYLCVRVTNPALCKFYNKLAAKSVCCSLRLAPAMIIIILVLTWVEEGDYKHWTRDLRTEDQGTRDPTI